MGTTYYDVVIPWKTSNGMSSNSVTNFKNFKLRSQLLDWEDGIEM